MTAAQVLTHRKHNHFEEERVKDRMHGALTCKDKTYSFGPVAEQPPQISTALMNALKAYATSLAGSKRDPLQHLVASTKPHTIVTKTKSFSVAPSADKPLQISKQLMDGLKGHAQKLNFNQEVREAAQHKQLERYTAMLKKDAREMGDLNAEIQATALEKQLKKDPLKGYDNVLDKFHLLLKRMIMLAENSAEDIYHKLEARTQKIEKMTLFSQKVNIALTQKDANGAINWSNDPQMKTFVDEMRQHVLLPDGYEWNPEQVSFAKANIDMEKSKDVNLSKMDETDMQKYTTRVNTYYMILSALFKNDDDTKKTLARNIAG